jgi:putative Holliday junction resolvase
MLAHPRPHLDGRELAATLKALGVLARDEAWTRVVVGLPRNLDGTEGLASRRARRFADLVGKATGLPVELLDERLSTREAQTRLTAQGLDGRQSKSKIDSASAAILLQTWLDQRSFADSRESE